MLWCMPHGSDSPFKMGGSSPRVMPDPGPDQIIPDSYVSHILHQLFDDYIKKKINRDLVLIKPSPTIGTGCRKMSILIFSSQLLMTWGFLCDPGPKKVSGSYPQVFPSSARMTLQYHATTTWLIFTLSLCNYQKSNYARDTHTIIWK